MVIENSNIKKKRNQTSVKARSRRRRKQLLVDRFGGKCCICGYNKCLGALTFHHLDPSKKEYAPCSLMNVSVERAIKELQKCILVCQNCHSELHSTEFDFTLNDSQYIVKWHELTCEFCKEKFLTVDTSRKFCTPRCSSLSSRKIKDRPTKDELKKLISKHNWCELGRMYSVSDNAVRKWAKKYQLI